MTDTSVPSPKSMLTRILTAAVLLAALVTLLSLGTWQMQRLHWKETLLADIAERRVAEPVRLADIEALAASGADVDYRAVTVTGTFDHTRERHFFATHQGRTGYYVYTPLFLSDGRWLFVNRGFVPFELKEPESRPAGQVEGETTVEGLARARLRGKPSAIVPDNDLAKNIFYWKDINAMAASAGLDVTQVLPFFVDAGAAPNPGGLPQGGVTQFDLPNNHLQYALTWYGLAAALVAVVAAVWLRRRRGGGAA